MGCQQSHNTGGFQLQLEYDRLKLTMPEATIYQNEFEKEVFMTINIIRAEPKAMIPYVRSLKSHKFYKGQPL